MSNVTYQSITCDSALNKLKRKFPYGWDLNIYRGCQHGCKYCYAIYSHQYLGHSGFYEDIYVKSNIVEQLERELCGPDWKRDIINIGGVTDSYQHAESNYKLMPEILKLLIKYRTPAIISTKSALVLRDYDLIDELSRITYINIAATITTMDEEIRQKIEPESASSKDRFEVLKAFRKTNASVGLHVMPIIPYLTDSYENFDALFANARESGVHYVLPGTMYLRGQTKKNFYEFFRQNYPDFYDKLLSIYKTGGADKAYKNSLYAMVNPLREKYSLSSSYSKPMKEKLAQSSMVGEQLSLL